MRLPWGAECRCDADGLGLGVTDMMRARSEELSRLQDIGWTDNGEANLHCGAR
jgi:hypothetical protein